MSAMEETMALHLRAHKLDHLFVREHRFHPERRWRFDFAVPALMIGVELQGGIFASKKKSGHKTGVGIRNDMAKSREAQRLGWRVFQFYIDEVKSGFAADYMRRVLQEIGEI